MSERSETHTTGYKVPTHEQIAPCAYHIYLAEGCPEGRALEHWFEAERQLTICALHDAVRPPDSTASAQPEH